MSLTGQPLYPELRDAMYDATAPSCELAGHDDHNTAPIGVTPLMECQRCGRVGWLLP